LKEFNFVNSKGISVLFLVIAMMLMITIGYVFSYLIPTKQKSVVFPIQSTQAFFIAQSGVEYAVRYAVAHNWRTTTDLGGLNAAGVYQKTLGTGRFTITYYNTPPTVVDTLTSSGEVPSGTEKRKITVTNFTSFMQQHLVLDATYTPCLHYTTGGGGTRTYEVYFHINDIDTTGNTILNSFRASWDVDPPTINRVRLEGTNRYTNGNYSNGDVRTNFNAGCATPPCTHTINPGDNIQVRIRWNATTSICDFNNLMVYFYDTNGNEYTFALDPNGNGLTGRTTACP
jgi:hypothetical protein